MYDHPSAMVARPPRRNGRVSPPRACPRDRQSRRLLLQPPSPASPTSSRPRGRHYGFLPIFALTWPMSLPLIGPTLRQEADPSSSPFLTPSTTSWSRSIENSKLVHDAFTSRHRPPRSGSRSTFPRTSFQAQGHYRRSIPPPSLLQSLHIRSPRPDPSVPPR